LDYSGFNPATKSYYNVAYAHPNDPNVWFGATCYQAAVRTLQGGWIHPLVITAVQSIPLPPMADDEVSGICALADATALGHR